MGLIQDKTMTQDVARPTAVGPFDRTPTSRRRLLCLATSSIVVVLGIVEAVSAGDGDLPDLARPNEMQTIVSTPGASKASTTKPDPSSTDRAVLALPGLNARSGTKPAPPASNPPAAAPGGLQLDAPVEMKGSLSPLTPLPRVAPSGSTSTGRTSRPLTLESPGDEPVPMDGPGTRATPPGNRSSSGSRVEPARAAAATQRRGRLFGLLPPAAAPVSSTTNSATTANTTGLKPGAPGRSTVESSSRSVEDPAETALKRRIEKQVREAIGDRARSIEVRVEGKSASVQARGVKLFQKRGVRKSIESVPALSGMRSTIDVLD